MPIHSCLGNHDFWSGYEPTKPTFPAEMKGTHSDVKSLGMPGRHYSFDKNGWHFVALNSMSNWPKYGFLTNEHFDWLKADLAKTPKDTPVCVILASADPERDGPGVRRQLPEGERQPRAGHLAPRGLLGDHRGVSPAPERETVPERAHAHVRPVRVSRRVVRLRRRGVRGVVERIGVRLPAAVRQARPLCRWDLQLRLRRLRLDGARWKGKELAL